MAIPVVLDVDTGIDDAMAAMFAVKHPEIDVRAITCVSGNIDVNKAVANTLKVLDLVGAPQVPVAAGADRPLVEPRRDASYAHGESGLGRLDLPSSSRQTENIHAVELLRRTLEESDVSTTVVALAPLTNIALLLRMYPKCADKIERIVFMGGAVSTGNATAVAEFNIWHDPEAAHIVLNSGLPLTMYGLDVFNRVALDEKDIKSLQVARDPMSGALGELLGFRMAQPGGTDGGPFSRIGDAGAVCALVSDGMMRTCTYPVQVEIGSGVARGQTLVDQRKVAGEDAAHGLARTWPKADVVLDADVPSVIRLFLDTLGVESAGVVGVPTEASSR